MHHFPTRPHARRTILRESLLAAGGAAFLVTRLTGSGRSVLAGQANPIPEADVDATFAEFSSYIESRMAESKIPGVAVGVISGDRELTNTFGVTSVDNPLPVEEDTYFQIGSTTKTFTGTTIMRLVEAGTLDLEAPVRTYLPDFKVGDPEVTESVQLWHLLTHTAGWHDRAFVETGDGDDALTRYVDALADVAQVTPLGKYFSYNNSALCVAGRVIEAVTGQTYEAAVTELLIEPLGTQQLFFPEEIMTRSFAVGHDVPPTDPGGPPVVLEPWALPRAMNPAGGLTATLSDQLQYARFYLGDGTVGGEPILSADGMRKMLTPLGPGGSKPLSVSDRVGVSWMLEERGGTWVAEHAGGTAGQQSNFVIVPELGFAITILTNSYSGATLGVDAKDWALEHFLDLPRPDRTPVDLSQEHRADYVGDYVMPEDTGSLQIREQDDGLVLGLVMPGQAEPAVEVPLEFVGEDLVTFPYTGLTIYSDFIREDGEVAWIRFAGRTVPRVP